MKKSQSRNRTYGGVDAGIREEERRKRLIEAGLEAFGTAGYAKANIRTICRLAGLTERYFYESFAHKEDLLGAVYRDLIGEQEREALEILSENESRSMEATVRALKTFFSHFQQDPRRAQVQFFEVLGVSPGIDREYQNAMRLLAGMVKLFLCRAFPGIREGMLDNNVIPTGLAGSIILIAHEWVLDGFVTPLDDIVVQLIDIFTAVGKHLEDQCRS